MDEVYEKRIYFARLICCKILTPFICTTGIVVNIINIIVLTRSWMKSSTNVYLTAVAASDLIYLTYSFLFSLQIYPTFYSMRIYMQAVPIIHGTANLFSNITTWLTVSFTIERFINISFPIFGHRVCTRGKAKRIVCVVCIVSFIVTFPDFLQRKVTPPMDANGTFIPGGRYIVEDSKYQKVLTTFGYAFINQISFVILPFLLLTIFNILLIQKGLRAKRKRRDMLKEYQDRHPKAQYKSKNVEIANSCLNATVAVAQMRTNSSRRALFSEQQRITVMLISIVVAFLILQIPSTVLNIISNLFTSEEIVADANFHSLIIIFSNVSNVLLFTNATMNFVFYSLFSIKFRTTCKSLFGRRCMAAGCKAGVHTFHRQGSQKNGLTYAEVEPRSTRIAKALNTLPISCDATVVATSQDKAE
ncbi:g protein coupled receptor [Echinococcus multilocularis]|uniref:G protein coupled receptor n=1 Tax=Echinococcus multilocularis TaxID=6211 RepID=A0A068Y2Z7_ECHMU|nr:g protein coupled receptor [Echinococcus multilocularis]